MWCVTPGGVAEMVRRAGPGVGCSRASCNGRPRMEDRADSVNTPFSGATCAKLLSLARTVASNLETFDQCLLWVTLWGVWDSSENWHLFDRFRETYGERRPIWDAPGHLFQKHEGADLTTFIQLGLSFGWDFYVVRAPSGNAAFFSHDEYLKFSADDPESAKRVRHCLDQKSVAPAKKG